MNLRSVLYKAARLLGDAKAVQQGRIGERLERRLLGRLAGRVVGALTRRRKRS